MVESETAVAADRSILSAASRRDPIALLFWVAWAATLSPYLALFRGGTVPGTYRDGMVFTLLGVLVALALLGDLRRVVDPEERRVRLLVAFAFLAWAAEEPLETFLWRGEVDALFVLLELFFVVHYALLAAIAVGDVRSGESESVRILRRLGELESALLALGLFVYYILLPAAYDPGGAKDFTPTALFYIALDLMLVALFAWRTRRAAPGERRRPALLMIGCLLISAADLLYLVSLLVPFDLDRQVALDPIWFLPYPAFVLAARTPRPTTAARAEGAEADAHDAPGLFPFAPGFLYAVLVPVLHLLSELVAGGRTSPAAAPQRFCALVLSLVLVALAGFHQARIARAHTALEREFAEARRRLAAARRLEAVGRLAAGVAHDFNNLLTVVLGRAGLLLGRSESSAARRDLETIVHAASRAAELTQELLAVGQRGTLLRARKDVGELVRACLGELAEICGPSIEIDIDLAPEPLEVEIDPAHFERVARALAANARDAMREGGRLTVSSARRKVGPNERVRDTELAPGDYAAIAFHDTGVGMAEETVQRLFEPFFTTKPFGQAAGLGLATAYGLVRQNGGAIEVASEPGRGSRFEVLLRLVDAAPAGAAPVDSDG